MDILGEILDVNLQVPKADVNTTTFSKSIITPNKLESSESSQVSSDNLQNEYDDNRYEATPEELEQYYNSNMYEEEEPIEESTDYREDYYVKKWKKKQEAIKKTGVSSSRRYSKNVSREELRDAVVWSEIIGPPVCKRRHEKGRRHK